MRPPFVRTKGDLALFVRLCGFKLVVRANCFGCDNDLARAAHDRLLSSLDEIIVDVRALLEAERDIALNDDPDMHEPLVVEYWDCRRHYDERWNGFDPLPLVEHLRIDHETRRYFDARTGRWHHNGDFGPDMIPITDAELCGLRAITLQIREQTGTRFLAYRIDWRDDCIATVSHGAVTIIHTRHDPFYRQD